MLALDSELQSRFEFLLLFLDPIMDPSLLHPSTGVAKPESMLYSSSELQDGEREEQRGFGREGVEFQDLKGCFKELAV